MTTLKKHAGFITHPICAIASLTIIATLMLGCADTTNSDAMQTTSAASSSNDPADDGAHNHPTHGPHMGELIELGNEEYHGELLHGNGVVTVFILDSSATKTVPIQSDELTVNVTSDGQPHQFKLQANRESNSDGNSTAQFDSSDEQLIQFMDDHDAKLQLVVKINGTAFRGDINHDHAGHDHDDEDGGAHDDDDDHAHDDEDDHGHDHDDHEGHDHGG